MTANPVTRDSGQLASVAASPEFTQLGGHWLQALQTASSTSPVTSHDTGPQPAGINIYFPPDFCHDYHRLTWHELRLKRLWLPPASPVASLWLRGFPLNQFNPDELTELVFRSCNELAIGDNGERGITLTPAQCNRSQLALIKGLGFTAVKLMAFAIDPDFSRARSMLAEVDGFRISLELHLPQVVGKTITQALGSEIQVMNPDEVWLIPATRTGAEQLITLGYRQLGRHCFRRQGLPAPSTLCYRPWGFYPANIHEWLGIGVAAPGMHKGYFYRNSHHLSRYRNQVFAGRMPVAAWQPVETASEPCYHAIQQLHCLHEVSRKTASAFSIGLSRHWVTNNGKLTAKGIEHIDELENLLQSTLTP